MISRSLKLIGKYSCNKANANFYFANFSNVRSDFGVSIDNLEDFYQSYCDLVTNEDYEVSEDEKDNNLHIAEILDKKTSPLVSSLFFKFDLNSDEANEITITDEFLQSLVYTYQRTISDVYNITPEMREFVTVVLETPIWTKKSITCFKIELRFPYCHVDRKMQQKIFKPAVIAQLRRNNVFSLLAVQPMDDWNQIIEDTKDYLFLYKSIPDTDIPNHYLKVIYGVMESATDSSAERDLEDVFKVEDHTLIYNQDIKSDKISISEDETDTYITLFINSNFWSRITTQKVKKYEKKIELEYDENMEELDLFALAKIFIGMLKTKTINTEHYSMDIGKVLYNVTNGSEVGYLLFVETCCKNHSVINIVNQEEKEEKEEEKKFSLKNYKVNVPEVRPVYTTSMCKNLWYNFKNNPLSIKTLASMARLDNKIEYDLWHTRWIKPAMEVVLTEYTDFDLAEVLYRFFWLDYVCSDMKNDRWWYFLPENHRLVPMDVAFKLLDNICKKVVPFLQNMRIEYGKMQNDLGMDRTADAERKLLEKKIIDIAGLLKKLKTNAIRKRIISMCKENFYVEKFKTYTNKGGLCTAWSNCVVEICGNRAIVRPGKLEDYLTKSGSVPYNANFSWEHPLVEECLLYLGQVFPDQELLHYALKDFSSFLRGKNSEKFFRVWTGCGNNSKSMLVKLMQLWFGELCIDLPVSVYTGSKSGGSGPSPELAQAEGAHLAITAEPDDGEDLKSGAIKRGTGGDRFFGRMCNENGGSIDLIYKAIYMCNSIPNIPNVDGATKDRFAILPFLSKWTDDAPNDPNAQLKLRTFKKDKFFEDRLPELAEAIFWIAVNYYHYYIKEGLISPPIVVEHTKQHWEEHDPYYAFRIERMTEVKMKKDDKLTNSNSITASDLYPHFKTFFRQQYQHSIIPAAPQFKTQMLQRLGPQVLKRWPGWIISDQN
jgi:hypothetical protein